MSLIQLLGGGSPFTQPDLWDEITFAGSVKWQGKIEIAGAKRKYKWDVKDSPGIQGATETYRGKRPEEFRIKFYIWTDDMWTRWTVMATNLFTYDGLKGLVQPLDVYHPSLALIGITQVTVAEQYALERMGDAGMWMGMVAFREYFPPVLANATTTPLGAANVTSKAIPGRPPNPALVALEARKHELQVQAGSLGLPGGLPP